MYTGLSQNKFVSQSGGTVLHVRFILYCPYFTHAVAMYIAITSVCTYKVPAHAGKVLTKLRIQAARSIIVIFDLINYRSDFMAVQTENDINDECMTFMHGSVRSGIRLDHNVKLHMSAEEKTIPDRWHRRMCTCETFQTSHDAPNL